jgi:nicotinamide-nucleotide amidase
VTVGPVTVGPAPGGPAPGGPAPGGPAAGGSGEPDTAQSGPEAARQVVGGLASLGQTVAVAESLTGGLVAAAITSVPGSSAVFLGGIVAYATDLKASLLGVPAGLLAEHGPVHPDVAAAMAAGVRVRLGATYGLATTGVAGPGPADGQPAGTVFVAVSGPAGETVSGLTLAGGRAQVRAASVQAVLSLLVSALPEDIS